MAATLALLCSCATAPKSNILVVSENGGHHKPFTDVAVPWLDSVSTSRGFTVTVINNMNDVNAEFLKNFNAVIQLDFPPYTWPEAAQEAFIEYVEKRSRRLHRLPSRHSFRRVRRLSYVEMVL